MHRSLFCFEADDAEIRRSAGRRATDRSAPAPEHERDARRAPFSPDYVSGLEAARHLTPVEDVAAELARIRSELAALSAAAVALRRSHPGAPGVFGPTAVLCGACVFAVGAALLMRTLG